MHYFQFNIKSYQSATAHLTNEEDIAYRRLIEMYYDLEYPIPSGIPPLTRRLRVGYEAIESVLNEFFVLTENGWFHAYCDETIRNYYAYLDRQKANGSKGGRPSYKDNKPTGTPVDSQNNPVDSQNNPRGTQQETINHKPITNINTLVSKADDSCPHKEIIILYHEVLPELPSVKVWNAKRSKALRSRWMEDGERQNLDWWKRYFFYVRKSDFLMGKAGTWQASLEWLVNGSNLPKVIEGNYENRKSA